MKPLSCLLPLVLVGCALSGVAEPVRLAVFQEHIVNMARTRQMSVGDAAREVRNWGIDGVDLWSGEQEETTDEILAAGFKPTSVIYFADFPHTNNQESADHAIAYAKRVGAPRIMLVPGFVRKDESRTQAWAATKPRLAAFLREAEAAGLEVDCEDFDLDTAVVGSGAHLREALAEFPTLGHVLDTGNYLYWKEDVLGYLDEFCPRIRHVHVKDRAADNPRRSVAAGTGTMPIREVVRRLQASGYRGWYTLECFDGTNTWKGVAGSAKYFSRLSVRENK